MGVRPTSSTVMNIEYLREFIALAQRLNYSTTAAEMHLHQSTLSKHIASLEKEFSATFFERSTSSVHLTEAGYVFAGNAAKMIDAYEQTHEELAALNDADALHISWGLHDAGIAGLLSSAMIINNSSGATPVRSRPVPLGVLYDSLEDDSVDAIVKTESTAFVQSSGYRSKLLLASPFVAVMERTHPLAERSSLRIDDLRSETLIKLLGDNALAGWHVIESVCQAHGFNPRTRPVLAQTFPEQFTIPLHSCVLIYPGREREIKFLSKLKAYHCLPFDDAEATFPVYCLFKPEKEERLRGFLSAIDEAQRLMEERTQDGC